MEVHVLSRTACFEAERIPVHPVDLFDRTAVDRCLEAIRPTHLIHLAWYVEHGVFWESERNDAWVRASLDLAESFVRFGGRRIVGAGTCAEYSWERMPCSEAATSFAAATRYGRAKHRLHSALDTLAAQTGLEVAWGRVFFVYGNGEDRRKLFSSVAEKLLSGERIRLRTPTRKLDFVHVDDVANAFAQLAANSATGGVNVASGIATAVEEAIAVMAAHLGVTPAIDTDGSVADPDVTAETSRIASVCNWKPRSVADGLADIADQAKRRRHET